MAKTTTGAGPGRFVNKKIDLNPRKTALKRPAGHSRNKGSCRRGKQRIFPTQ